jgi:sulfatase maturation enzyme AslB (radical SAM superfamily)
MIVSINPTYFCNFRCDFCYLTEQQLGDPKTIDFPKLDELLGQVPDIEWVDLYGGEIGTMRPEVFYEMKKVIRKHYKGDINIITNLSMVQDYFLDPDISLGVSFDFEAREKADRVFMNMFSVPKNMSVLILASPKVLEMDVGKMVDRLNSISRVTSVEIKPYSINQANAYNVTHKQFEEFVKKWFDYERNFAFINEYNIQDSLSKEYDAFSDDHVYITPNGKFSVLEFDKDDKEYFLELDSYDDYIKWTEKEKLENVSDICRNCKYFGHCLTEHYRYVKDLDNSCNGYKGLLDWYETRV